MSIKQAIEALELLLNDPAQHYLDTRSRCKGDAALAALRSMPEPVAWGMRLKMTGEIYDCITPGEHEDNPGEYTVPLYDTPHTAPLSDAWLDEQRADVGTGIHRDLYNRIVRHAVERAVLGRGGEQS